MCNIEIPSAATSYCLILSLRQFFAAKTDPFDTLPIKTRLNLFMLSQ